MVNQYVGKEALIRLIAHIRTNFASLIHTHTKADIADLQELTPEDAITLLMEHEMIDPVALNDGTMLLDENNNILVL